MPSEQKYDVVFAGAIKEGFTANEVQSIFVQKFKLSSDKIPHYFSGKRIILKSAISAKKAEIMREKFLSIGAETIILPHIEISVNINAKSKNQVNHQKAKKPQITKSTNISANKEQESSPSIPLNEIKVNDDRLESDALQKKIAIAQSEIFEQQIKYQIDNKENHSGYKKLTYFSIFLLIAVFLLYFYSNNS